MRKPEKQHAGCGKAGLCMKSIEVVAAVIHRDGQIFATARGYGPWRGQWAFPGGKIEPGETPQQALRREIREELDIPVSVGEQIGRVEYDYPEFHLSMRLYWCEIAGEQPRLLEHEAARWLTRESLRSVSWLPADWQILPEIEKRLRQAEDSCDQTRS